MPTIFVQKGTVLTIKESIRNSMIPIIETINKNLIKKSCNRFLKKLLSLTPSPITIKPGNNSHPLIEDNIDVNERFEGKINDFTVAMKINKKYNNK